MNNDTTSVWEQELTPQFAAALTAITDPTLMRAFLRDVMTEKEITEISARYEAARMLSSGEPYAAIIRRTRLSSRTVARISDWLQNGAGGYTSVIANAHVSHISPEAAG